MIMSRRRYFAADGRLATYFDPKPYARTPYVPPLDQANADSGRTGSLVNNGAIANAPIRG